MIASLMNKSTEEVRQLIAEEEHRQGRSKFDNKTSDAIKSMLHELSALANDAITKKRGVASAVDRVRKVRRQWQRENVANEYVEEVLKLEHLLLAARRKRQP